MSPDEAVSGAGGWVESERDRERERERERERKVGRWGGRVLPPSSAVTGGFDS